MDNPSGQAYAVIIDNESQEAAPGKLTEIKLAAGGHAIKVQDATGTVRADTTFSVDKGGIVNVTGTTYVLWKDLYGLQKDRKTQLNERLVMIDSTEYLGDLTVYPDSQIYIEKNWDYGLGEEFPANLTLTKNKDFSIKSKLYRKDEFIRVYTKGK